ncbi:MAG: FtsX-like permease family protein [Treponema sp.]|nr:FtsX-like permease family protein [Treponema sp.]
MYQFVLAFRSLFYRSKQYISLFLVCAIGIGISLFSIFLIKGMLSAFSAKAKIYYGGDLQILKAEAGSLSVNNSPEFIEEVKNIFPSNVTISPRVDYDAQSSSLYFEGTGVRERVVKGIDFTKEEKIFSLFNYVEGDASKMAFSDGILLSNPIANMLGARVGDKVTFMLRTKNGYLNTIELEVHGIFKDSSLFGMYTSYMDINCLRKALEYDKDWANRICIYFNGRDVNTKEYESYYSELEKKYSMFRVEKNKNEYYDKLPSGEVNEKYALIPLFANIAEVSLLTDAMYIVAYFIIVILVLIIVSGIGSTYRVLVMKRINEIGIYMAIGMKKSSILAVLLSEALFLLISGSLGGIIISFVLSACSTAFDFSFIPAFDIFLVNSHVRPLLDIQGAATCICTVVLVTLLAVFYSVWKSVKIMPANALSVTE